MTSFQSDRNVSTELLIERAHSCAFHESCPTLTTITVSDRDLTDLHSVSKNYCGVPYSSQILGASDRGTIDRSSVRERKKCIHS